MPEGPLNPRGKRVLRGLVRYPLLSDKELASTLRMKAPTVTTIRRKLMETRVLRPVEVPDFGVLGGEVLATSLGSLVSYPSLEDRIQSVSDLLGREEIVYVYMEPGQDFAIQVSQNVTKAMENIHSIEKEYQAHGFIEEPMEVSIFPLQTSLVCRYFDFTPVLDAFFGGAEQEDVRPTRFKADSIKLARKEALVLSSIVERPVANDTEHSERLEVSRITVGRARRRFREERIVERIHVPDLARIGVGLIVVTSARFHPRASAALKYNLPKIMRLIGPSFFFICDARKMVSISAYKGFEDYKQRSHELSEAYKEHEYFWGSPRKLLFSVDQSREVKDHVYAPLVGMLLRA